MEKNTDYNLFKTIVFCNVSMCYRFIIGIGVKSVPNKLRNSTKQQSQNLDMELPSIFRH